MTAYTFFIRIIIKTMSNYVQSVPFSQTFTMQRNPKSYRNLDDVGLTFVKFHTEYSISSSSIIKTKPNKTILDVIKFTTEMSYPPELLLYNYLRSVGGTYAKILQLRYFLL